ncbi:MAG: response regulator [Treponema sp.]|jgi:signal transduction histidine kinase|nr:response regulator [Treponema sp.]
MKFLKQIESTVGQFLTKRGFNTRTKLILIFVIIKVIPLLLLTFIAWGQFRHLVKELENRAGELKSKANEALANMGHIAVEDSVSALDNSAIRELERASTDIAKKIADFLYQRDDDILYAADLEPDGAVYRHFLNHKKSVLIKQRKWILAPDGNSWISEEDLSIGAYSPSTNSENETNYRNRPQELWKTEERPLYLEMSYLDPAGNEIIKVTTSDQMDSQRKNVSDRHNTYIRAETYFAELRNLGPGEIYVSDVIGAYVRSRLIGMYTPKNAALRGLDFNPREEAYAGMENPVGRRFKGIIRWAAPVVRNGIKTGYVTLALDHDHIMEFVDHITPMEERYVEMPSAFEGNYAFIWDYQCRSIAHPRHHSIVGFNPETGEPEVPWLEDRIYNDWQESGLSYVEFIKDVPVFHAQSRDKRPSRELTVQGLVGLDGRYLNNAPQCTGWFDLTKEGGSGSFLILWSGIWKPNTAAAIPYYTGSYGKTRRGFGFVAIGAGMEDFHRPARETEEKIVQIIETTNLDLSMMALETSSMISTSLVETTGMLWFSAGIMITLVVLAAIWIASVFSSGITDLISGIFRFRAGERHFRFNSQTKNEIGTLADSFDEMADSLVEADRGPLLITNMDLRIIYINDAALALLENSLENILEKPYFDISIYPANTEYDPIMALHRGSETQVLYNSDSNSYFKGEASYLTDRDGRKIGYIITSNNVSELMEQQKALEKATREANLANEHKGIFLARMSHEIRTPMNVVIGMTGIAKKKLLAKDVNINEVLDHIGHIENSSQHLLGLLNDILDISKIEAGKIELVMEEMDLMELAQTVAMIIQPRCEEGRIALETCFELPPDMFYLGDALRLRQVLLNLLGNAVKFTPQNGKVTFSISHKEKTNGKALIDFSIRDTGIGIAEDVLANLFSPFEQADNLITRKYGGTGLGLSISRNIVRLFGSDIAVKSKTGEGSEFSFCLELQETWAKITRDVRFEDVSGRLKGKRALLVDDVRINRTLVYNIMESTGIKIDEAVDGAAAVRIFSESPLHSYDIIYMDIQMPVINGYEAAKTIRALNREDAKTVPIVALTALAFKEDIDKSLASGMNFHLAKPLNIDKMMEITYKLLGI